MRNMPNGSAMIRNLALCTTSDDDVAESEQQPRPLRIDKTHNVDERLASWAG